MMILEHIGLFAIVFTITYVVLTLIDRYRVKRRRRYFDERLKVLNKRGRGLSCVHMKGFGFREDGTMIRCDVHGYLVLNDCEECEDYEDSSLVEGFKLEEEERR